MKKYYCECCSFSSHIKTHYEKHLNTKKHKKLAESHHLVTPKSPISHHLVTPKSPFSPPPSSTSSEKFQCKYCNKCFKFKQGMYRHIKYTCKKNADEDFQELARLLNEKDKQLTLKDEQMNSQLAIKDKQMDKQLAMRDKKMEMMQKQIDKLTSKLQIQNVNQGIIQNGNNIINIQVLNHQDTDYSHLTPKDYITCIKDCNKCVKSLIERVHFNTNKPENMNIYLSNIKGKYLMIYKDNAWQIQDKKAQVDELYDNNEFVLEAWYDEYKEKHPDIIASFQRYLQNRDENEMLNNIKEEILVMLYNKRKMIPIEGALK